MRITIDAIDHKDQPYETCGYWSNTPTDTVITVSKMGNEDYEFLVGVHELVEAHLCRKRGITTEQADKFDMKYAGEGEPGDDKKCPYRHPHFVATTIERILASELKIDWHNYSEAVDKL